MEKTINCSVCGQAMRIKGQVQGQKEHMERVDCKTCGTPNEVLWPVFAGAFTVEMVSDNLGR